MPFAWSQQGALQGGVPNQMGSFTPQNNIGLGVPYNKAMFNLPRYQMPGTTLNFGGNMPMIGGGPGAGGNAIGAINFSVTRQASSDPVKNIIEDIANPLGNTTIGFNMGQAPQQQQKQPAGGLRSRMISGSNFWAPGAPSNWAPGAASNQTPASYINYAPKTYPNELEWYKNPNDAFSPLALAQGISTNRAAQLGNFGRPVGGSLQHLRLRQMMTGSVDAAPTYTGPKIFM